jgi:hypothetical protein
VSQGQAAPGSPVTAVPWGDWPFAVFVTGTDGGIYTTAGNPQDGFPGGWASVAGGQAAPGSPVTVVPWQEQFAVFVTGLDGGIYTTVGDPQAGFPDGWSQITGISAALGSPVTAVPYGDRLALFVTDSSGGIQTTSGPTALLRRQFLGTATINIASGSVPNPVMADGAMGFLFDPNTRLFTIKNGFKAISIPIGTVTYDESGMGTFGVDGQITIPDFKITGSADGFSRDASFTLTTGSATSPTGRYSITGSPADSPADGLGNVVLVGAGQLAGDDFDFVLAGGFMPA